MYRKILLAHDGTHFVAPALRQAEELARHCGAELHLLGVVVINTATAIAEGFGGGSDAWGYEQSALEQSLNDAAQALRDKGLTVGISIRLGNPGAEIANAAHELKADLVVIGHSGKGVLGRLFQGSVGAELLSNLPCSLLIATHGA